MLTSKHFTPLRDCEIKMDGETRRFEGYASVFGKVDSYGDTVQKGAFARTLKENGMPKMFYGHSPGRVIGKWLSMEEDSYGLRAVGELTPGHRDADDVYASMRHQAVDGLSIGFLDMDSEERDDGGRLLKDVELIEVSVVSMPAEKLATITSVKSRLGALESVRDCELFLRDAGMTRNEAERFISRFKSLWQGESAAELEAELKAQEVRSENTRKALELLKTYKIRS